MKANIIFLFLIGLTIGFIFSTLLIGDPDQPDKFSVQLEKFTGDKVDIQRATIAEVRKLRILCFMNSSPQNHRHKAIHIYNTWGKHCDKLLFASTLTDINIGAMGFNVTNDHSHLWGKVKLMLQYIHKNFINDYDWIIKGDDDAFLVPENLRYMLAAYSPEDPIHFGHKFNTSEHKNGYFSGGCGYVMSNRAVRIFVEQLLTNNSLCTVNTDDIVEDWEITKCFEKVGVLAGDARDLVKRERFLPFTPESHMFGHPDPSYWYWDRKYYWTDEGLDCCSNYAIGYHYIAPKYMYQMYYLVNRVRTYGNIHRMAPPPRKFNFTNVAFILEQQRINSTFYNK